MNKTTHNPWDWQKKLAFSHVVEVDDAQRLYYCAGQTSVDDDGKPMHVDDMRGQLNRVFDKLDIILESAGLTLANVTRLNYYTTDVEAFNANHDIVADRLNAAGVHPASTLLGVTRLSSPGLVIEIEATAAS